MGYGDLYLYYSMYLICDPYLFFCFTHVLLFYSWGGRAENEIYSYMSSFVFSYFLYNDKNFDYR